MEQAQEVAHNPLEIGTEQRQPARRLGLQFRHERVARHPKARDFVGDVRYPARVRFHLNRRHVPVPHRMEGFPSLDPVRHMGRLRRGPLEEASDEAVPVVGQILLDHPERRDVDRRIATVVDELAFLGLFDLAIELLF